MSRDGGVASIVDMVLRPDTGRVSSRAPLAWVVLASLVALGFAGPARGAPDDAPRLELHGAWYAVVEPYRYVEARRFERGWNRGADVQVTDGVVRSPVSGTIRFVGSIADRRIVTIGTRVDGEPAVVTLTGLDEIAALTPGAPIVAGDAVGHGERLHVGAYDPRRRSRYLPVLGAALAGAGPAGSAGAGDDTGAPTLLAPGRSALAGGVAGRLRDAIEGIATFGTGVLPAASIPAAQATAPLPHPGLDPGAAGEVVEHAMVAPARAASWTRPVRVPAAIERARGGAPERGVGPPPRVVMDGSVADDELDVTHRRTGRRAVQLERRASDRQRAPITVSGAAADGGLVVMPAGPGARGLAAGGASPGPVPSGVQARPPIEVGDPGRGTQPFAEAADVRVGAQRAVGTARVARPAGSNAPDDAWEVPGLLAAVLGFVAAVWRRRRGSAGEEVPADPLAAPLPVLLPRPVRIGPRVVRTDGSSVLPDIALAWPDADRGSSLETDPYERAATRHTEHA